MIASISSHPALILLMIVFSVTTDSNLHHSEAVIVTPSMVIATELLRS